MSQQVIPSVTHDPASLLAYLQATTNQQEQIEMLIQVKLDEGPMLGKALVEAVAAFGFRPQRVGHVLQLGLRHFWSKNAEGLYVSLS